MALGDPYATPEDLKARLDLDADDTIDDVRMAEALATASREIEAYCRRQFNKTTDATARLFRAWSDRLALVDDFHTTAGLAVAIYSAGDGTYSQAWTAADYLLEPLNGVVDGQAGWPYYRINGIGHTFPTCERPGVQVTAQWGWAAVPAPVKEATLILTAEMFKLADAPFGVAGFGEFGPVRVRMNSRAQSLLAPYRRDPVLVA